MCTNNYQGFRSAKSVAHDLGLEEDMVRRCVRFYKLYGLVGLQRTITRKYNVKFNIVALFNWQRNYEKFGVLGLENKSKGRPKIMGDYKRKKRKSNKPQTRKEELLLENERLRAEIAVLKS